MQYEVLGAERMKLARLMRSWMMKMMGLPSCEEIEQFAYGYLENQLENGMAHRFERHLRNCDSCERFIKSYREIARPDRLARKISLDKEFEQRVTDFLGKNA